VYRRLSRRRIAPLALVWLIALAGCVGLQPPPDIRPQKPNVASLDPQDWYIYYSAQMPSHPYADPEGVWSFEFPGIGAGGHVNYVQTPFNATVPLHNVSMTFRVESKTPQYQVIDPGDIPPATVHLFFEQQHDDLSNPTGRWWASASQYNFGSQDNTTTTFVVPLTSDQWTDVNGHSDSQSFHAALQNIGWIGLTCGGQRFFGHGVALTRGSAKYVLIDLTIN